MLFDGVCRFCSGSVQFILRHDRAGKIHYAPLQSSFGRDAVSKHPSLANIDSVVLVEEDGSVRVKSDAVLRIAQHMGGLWKMMAVFRIIPGPLRDWVYDWVARSRYRVFGKTEACMRPTPEERTRFVDTV